ncbi:hypothetical protein FOZ60_014990 [Perkinsus olseni]|uniref:Uncharacterized protein n=1 Tax=Perkinsus olseni TaxID=32597 RepID=A0A7J6P6E4_PEROL|nr:hypothetical protein FOZ60_014990 [Perkinsus olseni]
MGVAATTLAASQSATLSSRRVRGDTRTPVATRSISPRRPPEATRAQANPFTGQVQSRDLVEQRVEEKLQSCLQRELDEFMSELAIVQRRCQCLEESLTIAESQRVKARGMSTRLKERLQLFHDQNAENCRIAEMEIAKYTIDCDMLKHLQAAEGSFEAERDEAFRSGQKLEESLRELARDSETISDQEEQEAQTAKSQLADLMEASLSQAAKSEKNLQHTFPGSRFARGAVVPETFGLVCRR